MRHRLWACGMAATIGLSPAIAHAASENHPGRAWTVLETPHFSVHYYQGEEQTARRVARAAEDNLPRLCQDFGVTVTDKIPVVLSRDNFFNGSAEPVKTRIQLDPMLAASSVIGTERFVAHELAHVVTFLALQNESPLSRLSNAGSLPTWFLEGIAQYEGEYWYTSNDRMLRLHTLSNTLLTSTERENFPMLGVVAGAAGYNEGFSLTRHLFDTYGKEKLADLMGVVRSGNEPNFSKAVEQVVGKPFDQIQDEWRTALRAHYAGQTRGVSEHASGSVAVVTPRKGEVNEQPRLSPDGTKLAYLSSRGQDGYLYLRGHVMGFLTLCVADADGQNVRELPVGKGRVSSFAWSPDGTKVVVSAVAGNDDDEPSFDLFSYDLKSGKTRRLTQDANATDPAWSPDGASVAFVSTQDGVSKIAVIDPVTLSRHDLPAESLGDRHAASLAWAPDGKRLVASIYRTGEGGKIGLIEAATGRVQLLTEGKAERNETQPTFTADGKAVVFASDRDGMQNLYRLELGLEPELRQLTRVYTGADAPAVAADGSVWYVEHRAVGSEIRRWTPDAGERVAYQAPRDVQPGKKVASQTPAVPGVAMPSAWATHPYEAIMTSDILLPQVVSDERGSGLGVMSLYSDVLDKQQLGLDVRWGLMSQRFSYAASYINRMAPFSWGITLYDMPNVAIAHTLDPAHMYDSLYWERETGLNLGTTTNLSGSQRLSASLGLAYLSVLTNPVGGTGLGLRTGRLQTLGLGWSDARVKSTSDADINPSDGYRVAANYTFSDRAIGSEFNFSQVSLAGERYVSVIPDWRHNLTLRWQASLNQGDAMPLFLGGVMGGGPITPLRGYNVGSFAGSRLVSLGLDYTMPVAGHIDQQLGPLYLDKVYASGFVEAGDAWNPGEPFALHPTAGAELRIKTSFMGRQIVTFRVGVARKLGPDGVWGMYLAF